MYTRIYCFRPIKTRNVFVGRNAREWHKAVTLVVDRGM